MLGLGRSVFVAARRGLVEREDRVAALPDPGRPLEREYRLGEQIGETGEVSGVDPFGVREDKVGNPLGNAVHARAYAGAGL